MGFDAQSLDVEQLLPVYEARGIGYAKATQQELDFYAFVAQHTGTAYS